MWVGPASPLLGPGGYRPGQGRARGEEALETVYAGIDVHRKRSQVAVLEVDGRERFNRNVGNGSAELAELPPVARLVVGGHLALVGALDQLIAAARREIAARARPDLRVTVLTALPGAGQLTAIEAAGRD